MRKGLLPALAALAFASCQCGDVVGGKKFHCQTDDDCTLGNTCVANICTPSNPGDDGGGVDSGPGTDGDPGVDAGPGNDAGRDAGKTDSGVQDAGSCGGASEPC